MSQSRMILFAVLAYLSWSSSDAIIKIMGHVNISPWVIMAGIGLVGALGVLASTATKNKWRSLSTKHPVALTVNALLSVANYYFVFIAFRHLSLTMFYIIAFTTPLTIAVFSALLKHEKLTGTKTACLVAGFIGALLAVGWSGASGDWIGYLSATGCVVVFAASTLVLRKLGTAVTVASTQFIKCAFMVAAGLLGGTMEGAPLPAPSFMGTIFACGVLSIVGSSLFNKAVQHTSSSNVVQYHYTQLVWGALFGYLIWNDVPTWNMALGTAIIISAGFAVAWQTRKNEKRKILATGMAAHVPTVS